ncbi:MAG TPA: zinc ribbon domain-containing protein [Bryobacteraceae bacterium]|nr:zinc ribbon domain-containing protein [Bryobacteraceae bacterium]
MPDYCTCGAQLPEDARFCHKCGKPQRDEPLLVADQENDQPEASSILAPLPSAPPPPAEPPPISFRNATAVRVAVLAGIPVFLLSAVAGPLTLAVPVAGGFFAVYLYRRRTGQRVTVLAGARLGWIAGIIVFAILTMLLTMLVLMLSQPDLVQSMRDQMAKMSSISPEEVTKRIDLLRTPSSLALVLLDAFLTYTLLTALGGAVGAKFLDRHGAGH